MCVCVCVGVCARVFAAHVCLPARMCVCVGVCGVCVENAAHPLKWPSTQLQAQNFFELIKAKKQKKKKQENPTKNLCKFMICQRGD